MSKNEDVQDLFSVLAEDNVDSMKQKTSGVVTKEQINEDGSTTTVTANEQKKYTAPEPGRQTYILFVGDKHSGKTTAQNYFLNPSKDDTPKPTVALEYTYGRRSSSNSSQKDIAHIWELGGGTKLAELIKVPMSLERFLNFHVVICVDLSKPAKCFDSLKTWMEIVNKRVEECMAQLERSRKGKKILQAIKTRIHSKYKSHQDASIVDPSPVPITIVCTKYDVFANEDPAKRKVLLSAIRYIAHVKGYSVYCTSRKHSALKQMFQKFMSYTCFNHPPTFNAAKRNQTDPSKPLVINASYDNLKKMVMPQGMAQNDNSSMVINKWKESIQASSIFPKDMYEEEMDDVLTYTNDSDNFKEEKIDAGRNEMDEKLAQYKREAERRARIEAESNREGRAAKKKEKKSKRSNRDRKSSNSSSNVSKQNDEGESKVSSNDNANEESAVRKK
jgi:dynein light intermediate chain 2, cytosolic